MTEINMHDINSALSEIRAEVEKKNADLGKVANLEAILDKQEKSNQDMLKKQNLAEQQSLEIKEKYESLEKKYNSLEADYKRGSLVEGQKEAIDHEYKSFEAYTRKNSSLITPEEYKYLRTDIESAGGYLLPSLLDSELIKKITEISNIESLARIRNLSSKSLGMPVRSGIVSASMVGEGDEDSMSESTYGLERLFAKKGQVTIQTTMEDLEDPDMSLSDLLIEDTADAFAKLRGAQFVKGSGAGNNCQGFMTNSDITTITAENGYVSGNINNITMNDLIDLTGAIKSGYNGTFGMNKNTITALRKLTDNEGRHIWQAGNLQAGIPNQILGHDYVELPDMPDIALDAHPVIFGDFRKGYTIGNRKGLTMIRDDVSKKREGKVEFTFHQRFAGMVTLSEAFAKLQSKA